MDIIICEQGTPEWLDARRQMLTGTKMDQVMGTPWDKLQLACELIAEEATEQVKVYRSTPEMERGTEEEVFARKHFENSTGMKVEQLGFCVSKEFPFVGHSGDGWIKSNSGKYTGAFENKSPDSKNSVFYKLEHVLGGEELGLAKAKMPFCGAPAQYKWQLVNYFFTNTDLEDLYFSIYDSRFVVEEDKMHVIKISRQDPEMIKALAELREGVVSFREYWLKLRAAIIPDNF